MAHPASDIDDELFDAILEDEFAEFIEKLRASGQSDSAYQMNETACPDGLDPARP